MDYVNLESVVGSEWNVKTITLQKTMNTGKWIQNLKDQRTKRKAEGEEKEKQKTEMKEMKNLKLTNMKLTMHQDQDKTV
jgi:hypothetical protein